MALSGPGGTWRRSDPDAVEYEVTGWSVWYADGLVARSSSWSWDLLPRNGVQVVMLTHEGGRRTRIANCDEYAIPGQTRTLLGEEIAWEEYVRISDEAQADGWRG